MVTVNAKQVVLRQIKVLEEGCDGDDDDSEEGSCEYTEEIKDGGKDGEG